LTGTHLEEVHVSIQKWLKVGALVAMAASAVASPLAHAEPLTPLTPDEVQYLDQARRVFSVSHDPVAFRSDGELLGDGRYACDYKRAGYVGTEATGVSPVLIQLAFIHLCPK
jgi:hypothetical protein